VTTYTPPASPCGCARTQAGERMRTQLRASRPRHCLREAVTAVIKTKTYERGCALVSASGIRIAGLEPQYSRQKRRVDRLAWRGDTLRLPLQRQRSSPRQLGCSATLSLFRTAHHIVAFTYDLS